MQLAIKKMKEQKKVVGLRHLNFTVGLMINMPLKYLCFNQQHHTEKRQF